MSSGLAKPAQVDESPVGRQVRLPQELPQQHAVSHVLDQGLVGGAVLKADGVADLHGRGEGD